MKQFRPGFMALFFLYVLSQVCCVSGGDVVSSASELWLKGYGCLERGGRHWLVDRYGEAAEQYRAAISIFERLVREHPSWQPDVVLFRLAYCRVKLSECEGQLTQIDHETDVSRLRGLLIQERDRCRQLSRELDRLVSSSGKDREVPRLREELVRLRSQCDSYGSKVALLEHAQSKSHEELSGAKRELAVLRPLRSELGKVLVERDELREALSQAQGAGSRQVALDREVSALKEKLSTVQAELTSLRSQTQVCAQWRSRALAAESHGDSYSAARHWQLCGERGGGVECWLRSGYWYWEIGERAKSQACLQRFYGLFSSSGRHLGMLSRMCLSTGAHERSLGLAALCVSVDSRDVSGLVSLGVSLMSLGDKVLSERYFRRALSLRPDDGESQLCLATLLSTCGPSRRAEAKSFYLGALAAGQPRDGGLDAYFGMTTKSRTGK